jgi:hypothetical protein
MSLERVGTECIGFSDGSYQFGAAAVGTEAKTPEGRLRRGLELLQRLNQCATRLHAAHPETPFRTIMLLGAFSKPEGRGDGWATAKSQEIEGILAWMVRLDGTPPGGPGSPNYAATGGATDPICAAAPPSENPMLLRVLVANAGVDMAQVVKVVDRHIIPLATRDKSVAGVVGLDRSTDQTILAIGHLASIPLPTVGTTLTADGLERNHEYYVQLAPSNAEQVALALRFAAAEGRDTVKVYYPGPPGESTDGHEWTDELPRPDDSYLYTMVKDLRDARAPGKSGRVKVELIGWRPDDKIKEWAGRRCDELKRDEGALGFFVGRSEHFGKFFEGMRRCADRLLADDDVGEYVVGAEAGGEGIVRYVSLGAPVVTAGSGCASGKLRKTPFSTRPLVEFCGRVADVHKIIESAYGIPPSSYLETKWLGQYVGLTYDAVNIFYATAADHGGTTSVDRRKVRDAIRTATFEGATSPRWDYRTDQIPRAKLLMILAIDLSWRELPDPGPRDTRPCLYVSYGGAGTEEDSRKFKSCPDLVAEIAGAR